MTTTFDNRMERVAAGERLSPDEIRELSSLPDILGLGMLADALRRVMHGTRVTYLRVAACAFDRPFADAVPEAAREIRITGSPDSLESALSAVRNARAVAGRRTVAGFSWRDVERFVDKDPDQVDGALVKLREAGLDAIAELPLDTMADVPAALTHLGKAGFGQLRLTIDTYEGAGVTRDESATGRGDSVAMVRGGDGARLQRDDGADRAALWLLASGLQDRFGCIHSINPLPTIVRAFRPTTGYEDVKTVAIARLAAPNIPTVQVDWSRYGPKLAQVALTFGADDVYGVSASGESPEGRRRAPLEEIRRNVEAAGFEPVERDGRFAAPS